MFESNRVRLNPSQPQSVRENPLGAPVQEGSFHGVKVKLAATKHTQVDPSRQLPGSAKPLRSRAKGGGQFKRISSKVISQFSKSVGPRLESKMRSDAREMLREDRKKASSGPANAQPRGMPGHGAHAHHGAVGKRQGAPRINPGRTSATLRKAARALGDVYVDDDESAQPSLDDALNKEGRQGGGEQHDSEDDCLAQLISISARNETESNPESLDELINMLSASRSSNEMRALLSETPELIESSDDVDYLFALAKSHRNDKRDAIAKHIRKKLGLPTGERARELLDRIKDREEELDVEFPDAIKISFHGAPFAAHAKDEPDAKPTAVTDVLDKRFLILSKDTMSDQISLLLDAEAVTPEQILAELKQIAAMLESFKLDGVVFTDPVLMKNYLDFLSFTAAVKGSIEMVTNLAKAPRMKKAVLA